MQGLNIQGTLIIFSFLSFICTYLINPIVRFLGLKHGFVDKPDYRKLHKKSIVMIGGISIITSCIFSFLMFLFFLKFIPLNGLILDNIFWFLLAGGLLNFILGIIDDIYSISPWPRLFFQIIIAYFIFSQGIQVNILENNFFFPNISTNISFNSLNTFISVFWIVGITNAINWLDGLDGLAAGIASILAIGLAFLSFFSGQLFLGSYMTILASSCLGFLKMNSYPAKIIMGDGGSYFLGFSLSSAALILVDNSQGELNIFPALILFSLPLIDMFIVILKRIISGNSPFYPDRNHLHHRLLKIGFSHKKVVYSIYFLTIIPVLISIFCKV